MDVSAGERQWVITAYTLAFAGLLLVGGRVADRIGRKRAFLLALVGFALASAVGGASTSLPMLVAARAGQGVFGALLAPTALSLVATTFPDPRERGRAFAVFGMVMGGGSGVGLVLGGALTEYLSWHWVLYVNVPLALAAAAGALLALTGGREREHTRIDLLGAALGTAGLLALVYGLSMVPAHGWAAPSTAGALTVAALLLLVFVAVEARVRNPLLPLGIVAHRSRGGAYLAFVLVMIAMFGMFLLLSFYLQTVAGYTALETGLAFLPFAGAVLAASTAAGRVMTRVRSGLLLAVGLLLAAAGMGWLARLGVDTGYLGGVLPAVVSIGLGLGTLSPVAANLATYQVPERDAGIGSALFNVSEQVGASVGVAVLNTIAATTTAAYLTTHADVPGVRPAAVVHGYAAATTWAAVVLAAGAVVVLVLVNARLGGDPAGPDGTDTAAARPGRTNRSVGGWGS